MTLALDGSAHASAGSGTSLAATLTTTQPNDVIIAFITTNGGPVTGVSGSTLGAFTLRSRVGPVGAAQYFEEWWTVASTAITSEVITETQTSSNFITIDVFGISGANTGSPFDGSSVTGTVDPVSISTVNANTMILGGFRENVSASPTAGAGYTAISGANFQLTEYKIVSTTQSSLSVTQTVGSTSSNGVIAEAIVQASGAAVVETNTHFTGKLTPATYRILQGLRQNSDTFAPPVIVAATQYHWLGRHTPRSFSALSLLRQNSADDIQVIAPSFSTPTHFIGKFTANSFHILNALRSNSDTFGPAPVVIPSDVPMYTLGRHTATKIDLSCFAQLHYQQNNDGLFNYGPPPGPLSFMWNAGTEWQRFDRVWGNR